MLYLLLPVCSLSPASEGIATEQKFNVGIHRVCIRNRANFHITLIYKAFIVELRQYWFIILCFRVFLTLLKALLAV